MVGVKRRTKEPGKQPPPTTGLEQKHTRTYTRNKMSDAIVPPLYDQATSTNAIGQEAATVNMFFGRVLDSFNKGAATGSVTALNLGQSYQGIERFVSNVITQLVHSENEDFLLRAILPPSVLDQHHLAVAFRLPTKSINGLVPYEGSPRLLTESVLKAEKSAQRRGVKVKFEGDYLKYGAQADQEMAARIKQMRWSVKQTMIDMVAVELSRAQCPYREMLIR
ncbi:MAG: hypothetical protein M0R22_12310, partial [Dehalococcoidia bacterium]|nr:hypothetical protein [Dehalococcoidia bacterium]